MTIRPHRDDEYEVVAAIWNAAFPMYPEHADEARGSDARRPERIRWARRLLEVDGEAVGFGYYGNPYDAYHPNDFWLTIAVRPERHGEGHGRALYEHLLADLEPHAPRALFSWAREDLPRQVRFWTDRGFGESMRSFQSVLDLSAADLTPWNGYREQMAEGGIAIRSYADLDGDPDLKRKFFDLHVEIDHDVPGLGTYTPPTFEEFCEAHFNDRFVPEGLLFALDGDTFVGMCELVRTKGHDDLENGLTGVRRGWRRRGVARALKLASVEAAQALGAPAIRTWNASHNRGMLTINEELGFIKRPATIDYRKPVAAP